MVTLKQARINAGLSQRAAATKTKVSRSSIQRIEKNGIQDHTLVYILVAMIDTYNLPANECTEIMALNK